MSTRYGDRGFGRYGDSDEDRTEDRDYERETERGYVEREGRSRALPDYGMSRRGGYASTRGGGEYGRERDYGSREQEARDYGSRYATRGEYGAGEYGGRHGREGLSGGGSYAGSPLRRYAGDEYGRDYGARAYGRDYERGRAGRGPEGEGVREYDTDYGRTTSRFYGRSGYEYGRDEYERDDDDRDVRGEYGRRPARMRGDDREGRGRGWWDRAADEVLSWFGGDEDDDRRDRRDDPREMRGGRGRGEGKFRGLGPRNYRRSDERVREEVCDRLTDNEWLDASEVEVNVAAGEVILSGAVDSRYAKRLAESIAESVSGVANVQNNLRVHSYQEAAGGAPALSAGTSGGTAAPADPDAPAATDASATNTSSRAAGGS